MNSSVYTIAAQPNPQVGLLDMVAVTTLGRMIYEDNIRRKYGKSTDVLVDGFRQLEMDIWRIAAKVLTKEQQAELRQLILYWRKNNPDKDSKPFDIKDYQETIAEVTTLVESTNQLVGTVGLEKLLPELVKAIDQVESGGAKIIDHSFRQAVWLILIAMGAYIIARLIYNFLNKKLIESHVEI